MATAKINSDLQGTPTDQTKYCSMIGGLMYLTASRPDISFATFVCTRYQARPTEKHLKEKTVSKVSDTKDTIRFKLETQEIVYTVDMFRDTLHLPVETPDNQFIAPVTIRNIKSFMQTKYPSIPQRLDEDYHSIKDDILFLSVYSTRHVLFRGMQIPDAFLTNEICATDDYKEYETVFVRVEVLMNQPKLVISIQGTHRTTPRAHRTPTLTAASPQGIKRKQNAGETSSPRKSLKVTIKQKKQSTTLIPPPSDERERDEITEATLLSLNLHKIALGAEAQENVVKVKEKLVEEEIENMVEEPESHKENMKVVDDDVTKKKDHEKDEDEVKDDDVYVEKTDAAAEAKDTDDHTNHTLVRTHAAGSVETRNDQMLTPIPTPTRSPRKDLSSDKMTANIQEFLDHCNNVVPEMMFEKTNEMIKEEMPCLVNLAVKKDREIVPTNVPELISKEFATHGPKRINELFQKHMPNTTLNLYPITSSSTTDISTAALQHQLYLNMKSKPQDQAADPKLWEISKEKFESHKFPLVLIHTNFSHVTINIIRMLILLKGKKMVKMYFGNYKYLVRITLEFIISKIG
uniref:Putative RNA-directed DNA polymerase n=1 Tax=Tanacetum cinerariifolium TaxID=118510 RepID=A0A699HGJ2_TANCI|nr:putative RNA-directed DNA polymerase [Tanacetum cinerariifolium]